jgi:hypothetical protein
MTREEVYTLIDGERDYQDRLPPSRTDGSAKSVGDYLTMLRYYLTQAEAKWTSSSGNLGALDNIRKIAGITVKCMEDHGAPERTGRNVLMEEIYGN